MKNIQLNPKERLYIIPCGKGYSCLGYEVCHKRSVSLAKELGQDLVRFRKGTKAAYAAYMKLVGLARTRNKETGWRSKSELIAEFIGNEGRRVLLTDCYGQTSRFIIGKTTGFIPCHIELKRRDSIGGIAVMGHPFQSLTFLN